MSDIVDSLSASSAAEASPTSSSPDASTPRRRRPPSAAQTSPSSLLTRLRLVEHGPTRQPGVTTNWHRNPDGPEAAAEIERLLARLAEAENEASVRTDESNGLRGMLAEAERDAARYRWLRDSAGNDIMEKLMAECSPPRWDELVDAAIDAAMGERP